MDDQIKTKPEYAQILVECYHRTRQLAQTEQPPAWMTWLVDEREEQIEHGPRYGCGEWFGPVHEFERMRLRRAIDDLERGGLIVTWRRRGRRLSNIELTKSGVKFAKQLAKEAKNDCSIP
ncbi:MAG: hypothetical protein ABGX16_00015 [Pirellulales bacterium]